MDYYPVEAYRPATMQCIIASSIKRNVPANVLLAIGQHEAGVEGSAIKNTNGSADLGRAGVNTVHLSLFPKYGVSEASASYYLKYDGCFNYDMAAYLLKGHLAKCRSDFWTCVGNYHSKAVMPKVKTEESMRRYERSVANNARYVSKIKPLAIGWEKYLSTNYRVKEYGQ